MYASKFGRVVVLQADRQTDKEACSSQDFEVVRKADIHDVETQPRLPGQRT